MRPSYVSILASQRNGTLYAGATSDLIKRVGEHKNKFIPASPPNRADTCCVDYEAHELYLDAARRENVSKIGQNNGNET